MVPERPSCSLRPSSPDTKNSCSFFAGNTIVSGYAKDYRYDRRMKYLSPPKFIDPVASAWAIAVWKEIKNP